MRTTKRRSAEEATIANQGEEPAAATAAWVEERTRLAERRPRR